MNYESFKYTSEEGVGHLILDKGEDLNKMTMNFWYELPRILDEIDKDASLRVLILSSTGKHFCAGMDLKNFGTLGNDAEKKTNVPDKARIEPQHNPPIPLPTITTSYFSIKYLLYSSRKTKVF